MHSHEFSLGNIKAYNSLLVVSQRLRFLSSEFTTFSRSAIVLAAKVIFVSSANILGEAKPREDHKHRLRIEMVQDCLPVGRRRRLHGAIFDKWHFWL